MCELQDALKEPFMENITVKGLTAAIKSPKVRAKPQHSYNQAN